MSAHTADPCPRMTRPAIRFLEHGGALLVAGGSLGAFRSGFPLHDDITPDALADLRSARPAHPFDCDEALRPVPVPAVAPIEREGEG